MPDAPGLELIRGEIEQDHPGAVLDTSFDRDCAALVVDPAQILAVLALAARGAGPGLHASSPACTPPTTCRRSRASRSTTSCLNRDRVERIRVKAMLADPGEDALPEIDSCVELFPTAEFQEREVYDFFGIVFRGHPDLTRILLPDDYVGWPQRRDFPVGGEPVTFTYNEAALWLRQP